MTNSKNQAGSQQHTLISAGPVCVDLGTAPTFPPTWEYRVILSAPGEGAWDPKVGGAAPKVALNWVNRGYGPATLVSRLANGAMADGECGWIERFGLEGARWLRATLENNAPAGLTLELRPTEGRAGASLTFHMPHPLPHGHSSITTLSHRADEQLRWEDVLATCKKQKHWQGKRVIYLSAEFHAGLLPSLALAIENRDAETMALLSESILIIEFGRCDFRWLPQGDEPGAPGLGARWKKILETCLKSANIVMADFMSATALHLMTPEMLPKEWLIVRPYSVGGGKWWLIKRDGRGGLLRCTFVAPEPPCNSGSDANLGRPWRVTELIWRLINFGAPEDATDWRSHFDLDRLTDPSEITQHPGLLREIRRLMADIAKGHEPKVIVLVGPTGSGKGVWAHVIHRGHPGREAHRFVKIQGGHLNTPSAEIELFGSVKDPSTGAVDRQGAFQAAAGGTVLLDDLDTFSLEAQEKLLGVLQDHQIRRVGGNTDEEIDFLLIVTSSVDPDELYKAGKLRLDILNRLKSGQTIRIPPLKERRPDALRTALRLWERFNQEAEVDFAWPEALETWIQTDAQLNGNYRVLEGIVRYVHQHARTQNEEKVYDASQFGLPDLENYDIPVESPPAVGGIAGIEKNVAIIATAIRNGIVVVNAPKNGVASEDKEPSPMFAKLHALAPERLGPPGTGRLEERLEKLIHLWSELSEGFEEEAWSLRRCEIAECLGVESKRTKAKLLRLLKKAAKRGLIEPEPNGRGSMYWINPPGEASQSTAPQGVSSGKAVRRASQ